MKAEIIRKLFLDFFQSKNHTLVPSSSLIPDDPSVLLTTAGMQQFKRYFTGELDPLKDFGSKNTASIQKCFRTSDIEEVGDFSHLTFFEMLGNFSFGGYFKKEAIEYAYEFITGKNWMNLEIDYVTVFEGDEEVPYDEESEKIWFSLGIKNIKKFGRKDNFWGPTGDEGPCGPTTEIYIDDIEVWNLVFNEYYQYPDGHLEKLKNPGVDTGMGLERLAMIAQKKSTIFETDLFSPLFEIIPQSFDPRVKRIIADHLRGISFLISDGVRPSNKEAGYILRRLIRRVMVYNFLNKDKISWPDIFEVIVLNYKNFYPELNLKIISEVFSEEEKRFQKTLGKGLKILEKTSVVDAKTAFKLYESYGLPFEILKEIGGEKTKDLTLEDFNQEFARHQEISRIGQERKFGGHGLILDTGELKARDEKELQKVIRLHTATHLLHQALREVLGETVKQMGSDITAERTRFDFTFSRKLTPQEIQQIENLVNQKIKEDLPVNFQEMPKEEAEKTGALHFFKEKYPPVVKVYYIGKSLKEAWSKEFCGGPHVKRTGEIGKFKIIKEESVSAGVRRIRGIVEDEN